MRSKVALVPSLVLALGAANAGGESREPAKTRFDLRASPRSAFSPVRVQFVGQLLGASGREDYHCPEIEWDFGDGSRSVRLSDCPPFEPGDEPASRFSTRHAYRAPGSYDVRLTLRRADRSVAVATTQVKVLDKLGEGIDDR